MRETVAPVCTDEKLQIRSQRLGSFCSSSVPLVTLALLEARDKGEALRWLR